MWNGVEWNWVGLVGWDGGMDDGHAGILTHAHGVVRLGQVDTGTDGRGRMRGRLSRAAFLREGKFELCLTLWQSGVQTSFLSHFPSCLLFSCGSNIAI